MGAKRKLNSASVLGSLALAGILGGLSGSWAVFLIAGGVLLAMAVHAGDIRLD